MKKSLLGYNIAEVDVMVDTLREENESLNTTITSLKTQLKNNETGSAKANLLEEDLKSREETIRQLQEEKNEFISQITSLTEETGVLNEQNHELRSQNEYLHQQNESLSQQLSELQHQLAELAGQDYNEDTSPLESLRSRLEAEQQYRALEQTLNSRMEELTAVTAELENSDSHQASGISFLAYYEMSRLRNVVMEYMQEQMKEYYQFVNENSVKMRAAIEQRQSEYNQMIREFLAKASDFRVSLSNMEDKYNGMVDYSMSIDKLSTRMNEIMNRFLEESGAHLKKKEGHAPEEASLSVEKTSFDQGENASIKPFMRKISG
ncbi:MAG TPA: hypothetical protein GXX75_17405 [Clostridiales bacterium]|nr:hypothetical protein [Clostridiales bacterium]